MFHFQSCCTLLQLSKDWINSVIYSLLQPSFHKEKMKLIPKVCSFVDMIWRLHFTSPHVSILSLCRFFKQISQPGFFNPSPSPPCLWTSSYFPTPFPISDLDPRVNQICWHHNDTNKSQGMYLELDRLVQVSMKTKRHTLETTSLQWFQITWWCLLRKVNYRKVAYLTNWNLPFFRTW